MSAIEKQPSKKDRRKELRQEAVGHQKTGSTAVIDRIQANITTVRPEPSLYVPSEGETKIRLSNFEEAARSQTQDELFNNFFGIYGRALVQLSDEEKFIDREQEKEKRFLTNNPEGDIANFRKMRDEKIRAVQRRSRHGVNTIFPKQVGARFNIKEDDVPAFLRKQMGTAAATLSTIHEAISETNDPTRVEVSLAMDIPSRFIEEVVAPSTDPILREQKKMGLLLAHIAGEIDIVDPTDKASVVLGRIQSLLNAHLYAQPTGHTDENTIRATFDKNTNPVNIEGVSVDKDNVVIDKLTTSRSRDIHLKEVIVSMRQILQSRRIINAYTSVNIKEMTSAVIKALRKAANRAEKKPEDNIILLPGEVDDTHRLRIAVKGGKKERDFVADRIKEILDNKEYQKSLADSDLYGDYLPLPEDPNNPGIPGKIVVTDDSKTNGVVGSSAELEWRRWQVHYPGLKPFEIQILDTNAFLQSEYQAWSVDAEGNKKIGLSHKLYHVLRVMPAIKYLYWIHGRDKLGRVINGANQKVKRIQKDLETTYREKIS